ncbi:hypothetical protein HZC32_02590, partial [Candidatus Woesearchaeota archaeon]|nr:hypothetical protein [Candidatus Woesearchaeota archaeon]
MEIDKHKIWLIIGIVTFMVAVGVIIYIASSGKTFAGKATSVGVQGDIIPGDVLATNKVPSESHWYHLHNVIVGSPGFEDIHTYEDYAYDWYVNFGVKGADGNV